MILQVARLGHPVLREKAKPLSIEEILSPETQRLIDDMVETLRERDGAGLAAPQVHCSKKIIVAETREKNPRYPDEPLLKLTVLINPEITKRSREKAEDWEGCLSVPELRGLVPRHREISGLAFDREGRKVEFSAAGFAARVIQHEVDHLAGLVFLDRMRNMRSLAYSGELAKFSEQGPR
ncbi:MAG: peptide deformylase [Elusimicrobia bacterium]|nr:peptide deformylase [Elusimicrobiota bacterium]